MEQKYDKPKKITHSTQPLYLNDFWAIKELKLSEVEEAIYGYSVEKMAEKEFESFKKENPIVPSNHINPFKLCSIALFSRRTRTSRCNTGSNLVLTTNNNNKKFIYEL